MWTMAISQHQFYLDKKQVEVRVLQNQSESEGQGCVRLSLEQELFYLKWWMIFNSGDFSKDANIRFVS